MAEKRGFLDRVLRFMGIEEEQAAAHDTAVPQLTTPDVPVESTARPADKSATGEPKPAFAGWGQSGPFADRMRMVVLEMKRFDDVQAAADHLLDRDPVVLKLNGVGKETARRIMDFISGTAYAVGGHIERIGEHMFLLAPNDIEIDTLRADALFTVESEGHV